MKMLGKLIAPLMLLLTAPACAQPAPKATPTPVAAAGKAAVRKADPALWVIRDKDTTIYLFGTIHVLKPGLSWFDGAVKKAFDASGQVVLELVMPDAAAMQALVTSKGMARDGIALTQRLPEAKRPVLGKALTDLGLPATAFDSMEPWYAATNLSLLPLMKKGYDVTNGPEQSITKAAAAQGKPVIGLETAEEQLNFFDSLSMPAQVAFLSNTIDELPKLDATMTSMVDSWARGDPDALGKTLNDDLNASPEVKKVLLVDRNKRWAYWISQRMKQPGVVFIAVGAGHLAGNDSVQEQLKGYRLNAKRVKY
ncbi:MAG: TraB/GumN family protein [Candidatus Sphingomonas phytovorans]|nr:TraB/GumN family protein [Sphingomonas sp.]WEK01705.1 MAG: TraB/GumN family protein [Sphingomonas sp.]